jgi:hypothetical protein
MPGDFVLVLNLTRGHVSPQFHTTCDPKIQIVREWLGNMAPQSNWQVECGFKPKIRNEKKTSTPRIEEAKEDHLQTQREEQRPGSSPRKSQNGND